MLFKNYYNTYIKLCDVFIALNFQISHQCLFSMSHTFILMVIVVYSSKFQIPSCEHDTEYGLQ
jgi:hypothetical protein